MGSGLQSHHSPLRASELRSVPPLCPSENGSPSTPRGHAILNTLVPCGETGGYMQKAVRASGEEAEDVGGGIRGVSGQRAG